MTENKKEISQRLFHDTRKNSQQDRARLERAYDILAKKFESADDSMLLVEMADKMAKLVEALTRNNGQLVELFKLCVKVSPSGDEDDEDLFDEIGDGFSEDVPPSN